MKSSKFTFGILAVALFATACNGIDFKKTSAGVPYKVFPSKEGQKIAVGNIIKFNFSIKLKDSLLNSSYNKVPAYQDVVANTQPGYDIGPAVNEIFLQSKKGDSIVISFSADSLLKKNPMMAMQWPIKKGEQLLFTLKVLDVLKSKDSAQADFMKEQQVFQERQMKKDDKLIQDYLKSNNIAAQKIGDGVYVQIINPGTEPKIAEGKFVTMFYKGSTLQGKAFDSTQSKPATFQMNGRTIKGFEQGLTGLGKGAKAKLFIPSMLGYGEQAASEILVPFSNLIFDVEIVDVSDTPPASLQQKNNADSTAHQ